MALETGALLPPRAWTHILKRAPGVGESRPGPGPRSVNGGEQAHGLRRSVREAPMPTTPPGRYRDPETATATADLKRFAWLFIEGDPTPLPGQGERLARGMWEGDPLADAWVEHASGLGPGEGRRWVERATREGIGALPDAPAPLRALFEQIEEVPLWLDRGMLDLAHRTIRRGALLGELVLNQVSLMGGYRYEGPIRPLLMTGRLGRGAERRTAETAQFVTEVTSHRAMARGGVGYEAAIQVRLLHARVRRHLTGHPDWDEAAWGSPISQTDMVGTNLLFSITYLATTRTLGIRYTDREARSVIHLWRYIGLLMGIEPELLPADEQEAARLAWLMGLVQSQAPVEAARPLGQALYEVPMQRAGGAVERAAARVEQRFRAGVSRFFLGDETGDRLGLPRTAMKFAPLAMIPIVSACEAARVVVPGGTQVAVKVGEAWLRRRMARMLRGRSTEYRS